VRALVSVRASAEPIRLGALDAAEASRLVREQVLQFTDRMYLTWIARAVGMAHARPDVTEAQLLRCGIWQLSGDPSLLQRADAAFRSLMGAPSAFA